jgi:outer membrane protein assembly factor BamB
VIAYAAGDGSERWRCKALRQDVGPSPIAGDGVVFVANEFPGATAIRLGGSGDVTDSHVVWTAEFSIPDTASPLLFDDLILMMTSFGTLACYDAKVGDQPLWEEDFDDNFQSSPTRIGDSVLLIGQSGKCWLIHPTRDQCETIGESDLGEECVSCPALGPQRIYIRGRQHLICIGAP